MNAMLQADLEATLDKQMEFIDSVMRAGGKSGEEIQQVKDLVKQIMVAVLAPMLTELIKVHISAREDCEEIARDVAIACGKQGRREGVTVAELVAKRIREARELIVQEAKTEGMLV
jgi:hypothetical protein